MAGLCTIFVFGSSFTFAAAPDLQDLAKSKAWLRLMHYRPTWMGWVSELDGTEFFFAPDGATHPHHELLASMAGMSEPREIGRLKLHPQCAFPERYRFLKTHAGLQAKDVACPKVVEFLERYNSPKGASLVFSSAYPNNPASMFGHTFLKIESERKSDLLDYGINFAADVPANENPFAFMYFGMTGGYPGRWSMEPYFMKVNEYVNSESRDLWEYQLGLTPEETRRLLLHIWELEVTSHFEYFFLDENCSYQVLRAFEAIKPEWELTNGEYWVIPGETIKRLYEQKDAILSATFRPSLYHQLEGQYAVLSDSEKRAFARLKDFSSPAPSVDSISTPVLNETLLYMRYLRQQQENKFTSEQQARHDFLLGLRAKRKEPPAAIPELPEHRITDPSQGHDPTMVSLFGGSSETTDAPAVSLFGLRYRTAYHDFMSPDLGYSPFSEIEFPWAEARWLDGTLRLHQLGFINSTSLFPLSPFENELSWRFKILLDRDTGTGCDGCLLQRFEGGGGLVVGGTRTRFYIFGVGHADFQKDLPRGFRTRPGVEAAGLWNPTARFKTRAQARIVWDVWPAETADHETEFKLDHSWAVSRNRELRQSSIWSYVAGAGTPLTKEFRFDFVQYFK